MENKKIFYNLKELGSYFRKKKETIKMIRLEKYSKTY